MRAAWLIVAACGAAHAPAPIANDAPAYTLELDPGMGDLLHDALGAAVARDAALAIGRGDTRLEGTVHVTAPDGGAISCHVTIILTRRPDGGTLAMFDGAANAPIDDTLEAAQVACVGAVVDDLWGRGVRPALHRRMLQR